MKILLVHPEDSIEVGGWADTHWDLVVDIGWSGRQVYAEQMERATCRVFSTYELLDHDQHRRQIRDLMASGLGLLVDSESIDWWDIFSPLIYEKLEQVLLLSALLEQLPERAEIFATRPFSSLDVLSLLCNRSGRKCEINVLPLKNGVSGSRIHSRRYLRSAVTLRPSQIAEIALDKWDSDYRLRRHFVRSAAPSSAPLVLLPSAYGNVSRTQAAYARLLPNRCFLSVVTRRSGVIPQRSDNIKVRALASYAPRASSATNEECSTLLVRWNDVQHGLLENNSVLSVAKKMGAFDGFPKFLRNMLRVRDAWRAVLFSEPVTAVLSADENNPTTRLPIALARSRRLRTLCCEHGALNLSLGIRSLVSDQYLVRGEMARDYAVNYCGLSAARIVIGSPPEPGEETPAPNQGTKDWIVFYSEAYELFNARTQGFYAELLPELCLLAKTMSCKVVVKLHPFESFRGRKAIINRVLDKEQRPLVKIREGPMTPDLFQRAVCSFTVESSVAVESTINGVPCFLCSWFDPSWYGYGKQYVKYSAGYQLKSPQAIREVPDILKDFQVSEAIRLKLRTTISAGYLDSLLSANDPKEVGSSNVS